MSLASRGAKPRDPPGPLSLDSTGGKPTASRPPFLPSHLAQIGCCEPPQNDFKIYGHFSPRKLDTQFWQFFQTRWYLVTDPLAPSWIYWPVLVRAVECIPGFAWSYVRESPTAFFDNARTGRPPAERCRIHTIASMNTIGHPPSEHGPFYSAFASWLSVAFL